MGQQLQNEQRSVVDRVDFDLACKYACEVNARRVPGKPLLGDYVYFRNRRFRVACLFGSKSFQMSDAGSFFCGGFVEFSGGFDHRVLPLANLRQTEDTHAAEFWFFHHGRAEPHGRVDFTFEVPVFNYIE
jgi:hypothetical protein